MFYGISILVGYLMQNTLYIWFVSEYFVGNEMLKFIYLHTVKWFQLLPFNVDNSVYEVFLSNKNNLQTAVLFRITTNNNPQ